MDNKSPDGHGHQRRRFLRDLFSIADLDRDGLVSLDDVDSALKQSGFTLSNFPLFRQKWVSWASHREGEDAAGGTMQLSYPLFLNTAGDYLLQREAWERSSAVEEKQRTAAKPYAQPSISSPTRLMNFRLLQFGQWLHALNIWQPTEDASKVEDAWNDVERVAALLCNDCRDGLLYCYLLECLHPEIQFQGPKRIVSLVFHERPRTEFQRKQNLRTALYTLKRFSGRLFRESDLGPLEEGRSEAVLAILDDVVKTFLLPALKSRRKFLLEWLQACLIQADSPFSSEVVNGTAPVRQLYREIADGSKLRYVLRFHGLAFHGHQGDDDVSIIFSAMKRAGVPLFWTQESWRAILESISERQYDERCLSPQSPGTHAFLLLQLQGLHALLPKESLIAQPVAHAAEDGRNISMNKGETDRTSRKNAQSQTIEQKWMRKSEREKEVEVRALRATALQARRGIVKAKGLSHNLLNQIDKLKQQKQDLKKSRRLFNRTERAVTEIQQRIDQYEEEAATLDALLENLEDSVQDHDDELRRIVLRLKEIRLSVEESEQTAESRQKNLREAEATEAAARARTDALDKENIAIEDDISTIKGRLSSLRVSCVSKKCADAG
uniref:EF-hand domain-containing protein n=2 Tax=Palpitomonas bilix TaxID=652834 RepID=A0A7S3GC13_9EUKA|mmetsp:Transcript_42385/g.109062  ORF Transcript_42385/g.109062 Transcript_42385/m.109062 type:complete len:609 (+) Transcript_42385:199-2025(+)